MTGRLNFEIDTEIEPGLITARAGVPSLIEAFRLTGTAAEVERTVKLEKCKRGLSSSETVESFLALWAASAPRTSISSTRRACRCCRTGWRRCHRRVRLCKDWQPPTRS